MTSPTTDLPGHPLLAAHGLARVHANGRGLHPIDLELAAGEFVALVGPSGAGKTTLLRLLAGLDADAHGEVRLAGQPRPRATRGDTRIALVFQSPPLVGRFDAVANVLGGRLGHLPRWRGLLQRFAERDWRLALAALDQVGLLGHAYERTDTLSGGERQRVAIARALAQEPRVLLLDEPVASLDPANARAVLETLRQCAQHGIAVLCSLHQPQLAHEFADRIVTLQAGRVAAAAPTAGSAAAPGPGGPADSEAPDTPPLPVGRRRLVAAAGLSAAACVVPVRARAPFDHTHAAWSALLAAHVKLAPDGTGSRVNYRGFARERTRLRALLTDFSAVDSAQYTRWSKPEQFAFLANAYNAFTVEKILTRYPALESIRDFGRVIGNPWKDRYFTLLGKPQHLDGIEHGWLRAPGVFDEPRVHVAVNCASIGCPMLGRAAFTPGALDAQLEALLRAFLADRSRNRFDPRRGALELSSIFEWYAEDFRGGGASFLGYPRFSGLPELGARYADLLADDAAARAALRAHRAPVRFLAYDWRLNAYGAAAP